MKYMAAGLLGVGFLCLTFGFFGGMKVDRILLERRHDFHTINVDTHAKPHEVWRSELGLNHGSRMAADGRGMEALTDGGTVEMYNFPIVPLNAECHILHYSDGKTWFDWKDSNLMYRVRE